MARTNQSLPEERGSSAEDDSPFLSIADFFSLVSLTVIYLIITFSPQAPVPESAIEAISGTASGTGPASATDAQTAYVAVLGQGDGLVVRVIVPGASTAEERQFALSDEGIGGANNWALSRLMSAPATERVMFYMNTSEKHSEVHKAFIHLVNTARARFKVSMIFLDSDEPAS